ncbi:hypothetical protein ACFVIY_37510, partial [Streptomyces sp. NPDC127166]
MPRQAVVDAEAGPVGGRGIHLLLHATSAAAPALSRTGGYGDGGWGGNKVRKLEWLLPEARRRGAKTIL